MPLHSPCHMKVVAARSGLFSPTLHLCVPLWFPQNQPCLLLLPFLVCLLVFSRSQGFAFACVARGSVTKFQVVHKRGAFTSCALIMNGTTELHFHPGQPTGFEKKREWRFGGFSSLTSFTIVDVSAQSTTNAGGDLHWLPAVTGLGFF